MFCACKGAQSVILRKKLRLRLLEKKVLERIYGCKMEEITEGRRVVVT
jgi:hypothetical protein